MPSYSWGAANSVNVSTDLATLDPYEGAYIGAGAVVGSTHNMGITGVGSFNRVTVNGVLTARTYGILLGNDGFTDQHSVVTISATGAVYGYVNSAIEINAYDSSVSNAGYLYGHGDGVYIGGEGASTYSKITNTGTIEAVRHGVYHYGTEVLYFTNSGTVTAETSFYTLTDSGSTYLTNTGTFRGAMLFGDSPDLYDGHAGHHIGGGIDLRGGNDTIYAGSDADLIIAGADNDLVRGGAGKDTLDGGTGIDTLDNSDRTQKVQVSLNGASAVTLYVNGVAEDRVSGFERVYGGAAGDAIGGDTLSNLLYGNAGNDTLSGGSGNDAIRGGTGADVMDGGANTDTADYSDKTVGITVTLKGATATIVKVGTANEDTIKNFENVTGGSGADRITGDGLANSFVGNAGNDTLIGGSGNDVLKGGVGRDSLDGGIGYDTADYSEKTQKVTVTLNGATAATVYVNGTAAANAEDSIKNIEIVRGGSVGDKLTGDGLANTLIGNLGNDTLSGGNGADVLIGGQGYDSLTGGSGADHFRFAYANDLVAGYDTITDFTHGSDRIEIDDPGRTVPLQVTSFASVAAFGPSASTTQFIYDQSSGVLYFDFVLGVAGGELPFAVLTGHPTLTASDLWWV